MKRIQLHSTHVALGAKIVPFGGFEMPVQYAGVQKEHIAVRNSVGIFDVSHMGEFLVTGVDAEKFLQKVVSNDVSKLVDGKIQYAYFPNEDGGIVDDLLIYKFSDVEFMLVVNASNIQKDWDWLMSNNDTSANIQNLSDEYSLFAVQGPKSVAALQNLTSIDLKGMTYYTFKQNDFAGVEDVIVSATGYTGAGGFELYVPNASAEKVWEAILAEGNTYDIQPIGLAARDTLRLEMGYCLYGNEINDTTSPVEAGLMWVTKLTKNFIGKSKIEKVKEEGPKRKLKAFQILEKGIPRAGYKVCNEKGEELGVVTSGTMSPSIKKGIGLAYISSEAIANKVPLFLEIRNKLVQIETVSLPFVQSNVN
jgi:aminomethyltransferase